MLPKSIRIAGLLTVLSIAPAAANPIQSGPLADFMNMFHSQAIPRKLVIWTHGYPKGTVVISTTQRRLYYVLGDGQAY